MHAQNILRENHSRVNAFSGRAYLYIYTQMQQRGKTKLFVIAAITRDHVCMYVLRCVIRELNKERRARAMLIFVVITSYSAREDECRIFSCFSFSDSSM